ncbi:MAG: hypothetical protein ACLTAF_06695 [Blautia coccoides]
MSFFTKSENYIEYHNAGETLRIAAWGENSLRVVSVPSGPLDCPGALKDQARKHRFRQTRKPLPSQTAKIASLIPEAGTARLLSPSLTTKMKYC